MSMYTKTSLKSVKKGDLVQMYLDLQAKYNDIQMDVDDAVENHFTDLKLRETTHKEWDALEKENEKLKEERDYFNEEFHKTLQHQADDMEQYEKLEKENEKLKEDSVPKEILFAERSNHRSEIEKITEGRLKYQKENNKLKKEIKDNVIIIQMLQEQTGDLTEEIKILKEHLKHSEDKEKMKKLREASKVAKEAVNQN